MSSVKELIRVEKNDTISFGNYELTEKGKVSDFPFKGDLYKVKSWKEITKLERNDMFVYESVPGTTVQGFEETEDSMEFDVSGKGAVSITLGLAEDTLYQIVEDGNETGAVKTGLGGKLSLSLDLSGNRKAHVKVSRA